MKLYHLQDFVALNAMEGRLCMMKREGLTELEAVVACIEVPFLHSHKVP
jgi:hypothetical protein